MKLSYQLLAVADDDSELNATTYWLYKVSLSLLIHQLLRHTTSILLDDSVWIRSNCFFSNVGYDVLIPDKTVGLVQWGVIKSVLGAYYPRSGFVNLWQRNPASTTYCQSILNRDSELFIVSA